MRTISESIAALERWRKKKYRRCYELASGVTNVAGCPIVVLCDADDFRRMHTARTLRLALHLAASEVSK